MSHNCQVYIDYYFNKKTKTSSFQDKSLKFEKEDRFHKNKTNGTRIAHLSPLLMRGLRLNLKDSCGSHL